MSMPVLQLPHRQHHGGNFLLSSRQVFSRDGHLCFKLMTNNYDLSVLL
jgi:hypothetical protein